MFGINGSAGEGKACAGGIGFSFALPFPRLPVYVATKIDANVVLEERCLNAARVASIETHVRPSTYARHHCLRSA